MKIQEAASYIGVSVNTLKEMAKIRRRRRNVDFDGF